MLLFNNRIIEVMKLVIIADIHDNLVNLKKALDWCGKEEIKEIICCGDVTNAETLAFLAKNFSGPIHLVRGNMEIFASDEPKKFANIKYYGRIGRTRVDGHWIGICHEPYLIDKVKELGECEIIFYGHTHKPWIKKKDGIIIANPGTLGGVFAKATFAVYDTTDNNLELKILETL